MPVSLKSARLGRMRSRPNKCSSKRLCLRIALHVGGAKPHTNPSSVPQYVTFVHSKQRIFIFEHQDIFARFWPRDNGPTDTLENGARLREIALELQEIALEVAGCKLPPTCQNAPNRCRFIRLPLNTRLLPEQHSSSNCPTPCYTESVGVAAQLAHSEASKSHGSRFLLELHLLPKTVLEQEKCACMSKQCSFGGPL